MSSAHLTKERHAHRHCTMVPLATLQCTGETWGLVDHLAASGDLVQTAESLAADVLAASPDHASAIKHLIG